MLSSTIAYGNNRRSARAIRGQARDPAYIDTKFFFTSNGIYPEHIIIPIILQKISPTILMLASIVLLTIHIHPVALRNCPQN